MYDDFIIIVSQDYCNLTIQSCLQLQITTNHSATFVATTALHKQSE